MAHTPQKFREIVFQLLFCLDFSSPCEIETGEMLSQKLAVSKELLRRADARAKEACAKFPEIDRKIAALSQGYEFDRIPRVERAILRLGLFEILYDSETPSAVAVAEGVRLARKFATPEAANFVNAILDGALKDKSASAIV